MKIQFDDRSFIECRKANSPDKILLIISAKDSSNTSKKITNAVELTMDEFKLLISEIK